eukprot:TRINITY_DN89080_c0_g1_i1.p2 TRINITY_DN89080_c0_g1~~TRINITY_DN89080_c0_g1_i1.p2  ORF type:complete len:119 (+),score=3.67 TRINITY_DN89080_c0_g1_i1:863-1219(+)
MRTTSIHSIPKKLILHVKRFHSVLDAQGRAFSVRADTKLAVPILLNVQPYMHASEAIPLYRFRAAVLHHGQIGNGHYTAVVSTGEAYMHLDDQVCQTLARQQLHAKLTDAYVLLYTDP